MGLSQLAREHIKALANLRLAEENVRLKERELENAEEARREAKVCLGSTEENLKEFFDKSAEKETCSKKHSRIAIQDLREDPRVESAQETA